MRSLRTLLAIAFAFLMGGAGVHDTLLLCRTEMTTHRACCCGPGTQGATAVPPRTDELRRPTCCDEVVWATLSIPPSWGSVQAVAPPPVLLERGHPNPPTLALVSAPAPALVDEIREATGPPIPIKHRALLL